MRIGGCSAVTILLFVSELFYLIILNLKNSKCLAIGAKMSIFAGAK